MHLKIINRPPGLFEICFLIILIAGPCLAAVTGAWALEPPPIQKGVLDLREWKFQRNGPVALDGQWQFYWRQFISPGSFSGAIPPATPDYLTVPYVWNGHRVNGQQLGGAGYATYRLYIRLPATPRPLGLHMLDAATACRAYANGQLVYQAGTPGMSLGQSSPSFLPTVINLPSQGNDIDLVLHVSNYHHRQGGLWDRITLGDPAQLHKIREKRIAYNMILFGSLLLAGIYHLGLYLLRRHDLSPLYFGLGCLAILLRTMTTGERFIVQLFPAFPFELLSKMEYLGFYLAIGCFALFGQSLFPRESDRNTIRLFSGAAVGFSVLVLLTPLRFYSYSTPAYEVVTILALIYGFVIMGRAVLNKRPGAGLFLISFIILSATAVNDILYSRQFIHSAYIVQLGLVAFILAQTFLLATRFSNSINTVEVQQLQLRRNEEKYRLLVDNASDGIFILQNSVIRFLNPRTRAITGVQTADLNGLAFSSLVHPADRPGVHEHFQKGALTSAGITTHACRLDNIPGDSLWVELNTVPTIWEGNPATLNFMRDISNQKKLEDQLRQARKMEALGTLSGGIAQNFNNILGNVLGNTELLIDKLSPGDPRKTYLHQITAACMKARQMVQQVLIYSRKGKYTQHPVSIDKVIAGAVKFLGASIPPEIKVLAHITTRSTLVMANDTQLSQLLLNLATNSAHAMHGRGGSLHISLHNQVVMANQGPGGIDLPPGHYVRLTVADNGCGIPVDVQDRIFDPYFTTKSAGQGTGMGLSVVMGIVKSHRGHINLVSTPGLGTTFHIHLPIHRSETRSEMASPDGRTPVGWERLLVVDDDERLLKVLDEMLTQLGYTVSPFKHAEAALEVLHTTIGEYDLIITNLSMPGMTGIEFAHRVKDLYGNLPVILSTGYLEQTDFEQGGIIAAVLEKPFHKEELARVVRAVLDEKVKLKI